MTVCAVLLAKDEADIIRPIVEWLVSQVDHVIVADNMSTDGTWEQLLDLEVAHASVEARRDEEPGYWQSRKMTALALEAYERGFQWVVPCDADELWHANDMRRLGDFLDGSAPDVQIVKALMYHHIPTIEDPALADPLLRIGWRKREHGALPKVACRCRPDLVIHAGNHGASTSGTALAGGGVSIRHYSWRTPEQYLRKIRNGERAYAATDLPVDVGAHWRAFEGKPDEAVTDHFAAWFHSNAPRRDESLIYDPAPVPGRRVPIVQDEPSGDVWDGA